MIRIPISHASDVIVARRTAKTMAQSIGFDDQVGEEIALVVSELAANVLKHAKKGTLTLTQLAEGGQTGIQIDSVDGGPGISDVEQAITDGFSTIGSLGYGLGTTNRLMDEFNVSPRGGTEKGVRVICRRWRRVGARAMSPCPLDFGAATRPHPKMRVNGDAFILKRWNTSALVGVLDGLGHGQFALRAAQKARRYIEDHFDRPLTDIFQGVQRSCRTTRGLVMALARFDFGMRNAECGLKKEQSLQSSIDNHKSTIRMSFASIGNIEARVFQSSEPVRFVLRRGIVGKNSPRPLVTVHPWDPVNIMVIHSDGMTSHWQWKDFLHLAGKPPAFIARGLLRAQAKDNDDATVVVVKQKV